MFTLLSFREYSSSRLNKQIFKELVSTRIPKSLREHEFPPESLKLYDKVFASAWLDYKTFVFGTKDNKFIRWDRETNQRVEIPLLRHPTSDITSPSFSCGIHSISINYSNSLLATGGLNPNEVSVFTLPSFQPYSILSGHSDWLFASAWLTDEILVTGSRDKSVKFWNVKRCKLLNCNAIITKKEHSDKVRDLKYFPKSEVLTTLSSDGTCKIWDPHLMEVVKSVTLSDTRETVCMSVHDNLIAIGSQRFVTLLDARCAHVTKKFASVDDLWGVRSMSFHEHVLTIGGGRGYISFFDLRNEKYILLHGAEDEDKDKPVYDSRNLSYSTGKGYLDENQTYRENFAGQRIHHAVYTHCYDVTHTKLLVGGGPLHFGLRGCYVAVWE